MNGPKIVTAFVFLSLTNVACQAKFTSKNAPKPTPSTSLTDAPVANNPAPQAPPVQRPPAVQPNLPPPIASQPTEAPGQEPILPPTPKLQCPTKNDNTIDPRSHVQRKTIVFKRGRQMVWRKNCEGQVVSKTWENLKGKTSQLLRIRPNAGGGPLMISNRTTCDSSNIQVQQLQANRNGEYSISVSTVASNKTLLVKPGVNIIDFELGGERGTLILTVRIDNNAEDCVVINARGCAPKREATWSDTVFSQN